MFKRKEHYKITKISQKDSLPQENHIKYFRFQEIHLKYIYRRHRVSILLQKAQKKI